MDARTLARESLIKAIQNDDPERSGCAMLVDGHLVAWHGSGDADSPYDFFVFQESFRGDDIQPWQAKLINESKYQQMLGCRSVASLRQTWVCSYHKPITPEVCEALKLQFVGN